MAESPPGRQTPGAVAGTMPFRMLLDEAMQKTREHFRAIFIPFALPLAALSSLWTAAYVAWIQGFATAAEEGALEAPMAAGGAAVACSAVLYSMVIGLAYAALWSASHEAVAGRPVAARESWRFVFRPAVFTTLVLAFVLVLIGAFCCFFPAIYVGLLVAFIVPVMAEEEVRGMDAIRRSASLVRHNPRGNFLDAPIVKVFVLGTVAIIISSSFSLLFNLPISVLQNAMQFRESSGGDFGITPWLWLSVPLQAISSLTWTVVQIYLSMGIALLYFDVRRRREASDLEAALDSLSADPPE